MVTHSVDRSLLTGIAVTLLSTLGQPELEKLLNQVVTNVGKENAGPVLLGFKGAVDNVIKKNKIKA